MVQLRIVRVDGSPDSVAPLVDALADALDGGPPVLPLPASAPTGGPDAPAPDVTPPPGTAVVIATSGSTGEAKLVALSAAALRASADATAVRLAEPGTGHHRPADARPVDARPVDARPVDARPVDAPAGPTGGTAPRFGDGPAHHASGAERPGPDGGRWLLALPAEHVAGVQVIVRALLAGAPPSILDIRGGFRVEAFAAATTALGSGPRRTSLVPTQLRRVLDAGADAALRAYDAILVGGAALDPALHERARAAGARVVATYGMSETAGGCVYDGVPLDGVTVDLEDDGRILLGGPTLAIGYVGGESFAGRFSTGDLGRWRDGRLEVLGRADDVIVTGGEKVAPAAVERVLAAQPGVRGVCVVGIPDAEWGQQVVAAVVTDTPDPDALDLDALRAAVRAELGRAAVPRRIVAVPEIPVHGIGKPDRAAVTRMVHTRWECSPTVD